MNREIKFRAFCVAHKKMYNNYDLMKEGFNPIEETKINNQPFIFMQYTGLEDKNGVEIYEGDIIEWKIDKTDLYFKGIVEWDEDHTCFYLDSPLSEYNKLTYKSVCLKILGNIYENPELLTTN